MPIGSHHRIRRFGLVFVTLSTVSAQLLLQLEVQCCEISHVAQPGVGFFENEAGSYFDIFETSDGYFVEVFLKEGDIRGPGIFAGTWAADCWTNLRYDTVIFEGEFTMPASIEFHPFNDEGGTFVDRDAGINLPPQSDPYGVAILVEVPCDSPHCAPLSKLTFEYSVTSIAPPLSGDFNFDDAVNSEDFLILSSNFGARFRSSWRDGDATLNGTVDFADFLILSANFGAVRNLNSPQSPSHRP